MFRSFDHHQGVFSSLLKSLDDGRMTETCRSVLRNFKEVLISKKKLKVCMCWFADCVKLLSVRCKYKM